MEPLQHNPRIKQLIKDSLYDFLYTPAQRKFKTRLDTIIIRNALLGGYGHKSFTYKGVHYSCDSVAPSRNWNRLLPQLRDQMDEYLYDLIELNDNELPLVLSFINQVLNSSNNPGDYLRLFPESVHQPIMKLIASCPYQAKQLSDEQVALLQEQNKKHIELIKKRMVTNLLI
jgi:hypothetical protein